MNLVRAVRYVVLKGYKERNDLARAYRAMRRESPAIARMVWRRVKTIERKTTAEFADMIFNSSTGPRGLP